jgi:uncharacterized sodium:solute symporter family permease YidK
MGDVESIVKLVLTVNVPFGAAILTSFFWRRLTATAVWWSVSLTVIAILTIQSLLECSVEFGVVEIAPDIAHLSEEMFPVGFVEFG